MNTNPRVKWFKLFRLASAMIDASLFYFCTYLALMLRYYINENIDEANLTAMTNVLPFICLIGVGLLYIYGVYDMQKRSRFDIIYSVILTVFLLTVITMALSFFTRSFAFPRSIIAIGAVLQVLVLCLWHIPALHIGQWIHGRQPVMIVGHGLGMSTVAEKIALTEGRFFEIAYYFDLDKEQYKNMRRLISKVEHVFICPEVTEIERHKIFSHCIAQNTGIFLIPDLFDISVKNASLQTIDDTPVLKIGQLSLTWEQRILKRTFDLVFSFLFIIAVSPVMLLCWIAVRLSSSGPAIFIQERITESNKVFMVYKFRTMYMDAESKTGPVFASEKDTRVTKVGAMLRATRLDELPQFFNVIKGEMSVVGPRPERPFFIEQFKSELPDYDYRAAVKAGITGYAQVMGKYTTTASDKLRFDLWYIRNYSIWLDITLIIKTVKLLFKREASKGISQKPAPENKVSFQTHRR